MVASRKSKVQVGGMSLGVRVPGCEKGWSPMMSASPSIAVGNWMEAGANREGSEQMYIPLKGLVHRWHSIMQVGYPEKELWFQNRSE